MKKRMAISAVVAVGVLGLSALPADAAVTPLPVDLQGGGPGGSLWEDFDNDGYYCQDDSGGFNLNEAELDPDDVTPVGIQEDAFDDAFLLADGANVEDALYFDAPGGQVDLADGSIATDPAPFGGLQVAVTHTAFGDAARLRTIYTFVNPSDQGVTHTYQTETDLGSDGATAIAGTSGGDASWTADDRWLVTWEATDTPPPSDPVITTVIQGSGDVQSPDLVSFACLATAPTPEGGAADLLRTVWTMSVPAGATRHVVLFTELNQTTDAALAAAPAYDAPGADSPLFAGIPAEQLPNIVNWDFGTPPPPPPPPTTAAPTTVAPTTPPAASPAVVTPAFTG